jgi:hypothetical protein
MWGINRIEVHKFTENFLYSLCAAYVVSKAMQCSKNYNVALFAAYSSYRQQKANRSEERHWLSFVYIEQTAGCQPKIPIPIL